MELCYVPWSIEEGLRAALDGAARDAADPSQRMGQGGGGASGDLRGSSAHDACIGVGVSTAKPGATEATHERNAKRDRGRLDSRACEPLAAHAGGPLVQLRRGRQDERIDCHVRDRQGRRGARQAASKPAAKQKWETPKLEDVSEQVMAQPYIRFT